MKKINYGALAEGIFFAFVSLCFYRFLWMLLIDIGSKHDGGGGFYLFPTIYPRYLLLVIHVYALFVIHHLRHPHSERLHRLTFKVNGIILAALGFLLTLTSVIKIFTGNAPIDSFYNISFMFTLDCPIWGIIYAILGLLLFFYERKYYKAEDEVYEEKVGNPILRSLKNVGKGIYVVFALFYTGDFISSPMTFDHSFTHFFSMLPVYFLIALFPASLIFYEFVYKKKSFDYVAKKKWELLASTILLGVLLVSSIWILIANSVDPNFLTEGGTALFPIEHMLFGIPAVGPIIAIIFVGVASCLAIVDFMKPEKKENQ
ncbi:MAG: hypothetical protein J6328_03575 [Bacilli bacterium]|nr:hypothetical protein [Bacilli bacterium]